MLKKLTLLFSSLLLVISCTQNKSMQQAKFHDDGRPKPIVAVYPMIDSSDQHLRWSLSEELHTSLTKQLKHRDRLYVVDSSSFHFPPLKSLNLFNDHHWKNKEGYPYEYVCLFEIMEHEFTPRDTTKADKRVSHDLDITTRIKVLDVRGSEPVTILQEIIHQRSYIPWQFNFINYEKVHPETTPFPFTPVGIAHNKMVKTLMLRMEEYILLAQMNHDHTNR